MHPLLRTDPIPQPSAPAIDPHKAQAMAAAPDFPWLEADRLALIQSLLTQAGVLPATQSIRAAEKAGEGNMNLTLRVWLDAAASDEPQTLIIKQARPWVEKYPMIAAPTERSAVERCFYETIGSYPDIAERMPRLLGGVQDANLTIFEDLGSAADQTQLYQGQPLKTDDLQTLMRYLAQLHTNTRGPQPQLLTNRTMRALNHEHIFDLPLRSEPALDLQAIEPGLAQAAAPLRADASTRDRIAALGRRYLADPQPGDCLLHGDFFPGSWIKTGTNDQPENSANAQAMIWVIDPEFCFVGPAGFDLGVALAHLVMAGHQNAPLINPAIAAYQDHNPDGLDLQLALDFAAVEILRRQLGVAQLPLTGRPGFRGRLVTAAHRALGQNEPAAKIQTLQQAAPER